MRLSVRIVLLSWGLIALGATLSWACDVPVFRYALEFWPSSGYEATVVHRGALDAALRKQLDTVQAMGGDEGSLNLAITDADLNDPKNAAAEALWKQSGAPQLPAIVLKYPPDLKIDDTVWSGPLTSNSVQGLVSSPARDEIAKRLLAGQTAVFVLVESGDAAKDEAARALLDERLKSLQKSLRLPQVTVEALEAQKADGIVPTPPVFIQFSMLTLSRKDTTEAPFLGMLLHSESDLLQYNADPIVFPVYGRGRSLYALVGKGIDSQNINEACKFLVGICSCQAKEQNPGTDLLIHTVWDILLKTDAARGLDQAPLVGLQTLARSVQPASGPSCSLPASYPSAQSRKGAQPPLEASVDPPSPAPSIVWNLILSVVAIIVLSVVVALFVLRQSSKERA